MKSTIWCEGRMPGRRTYWEQTESIKKTIQPAQTKALLLKTLDTRLSNVYSDFFLSKIFHTFKTCADICPYCEQTESIKKTIQPAQTKACS